MKFIEKITGSDITKKMDSLEERVSKLPKDYCDIWIEIKEVLWNYSDFTGRKVVNVLESIVEMLEENVLNNLSAKDAFGDNINDFCRDIAQTEDLVTFQDKWRKQLNKSALKKLGK